MKKLFLFLCLVCIVSKASSEDLYPKGYVDLGLPSGTLWKDKDEPGGLYTQTEAMEKFGDKMPTDEQIEELVNLCKWTWSWDTYTYKVVGPNGKSIVFKATGTWPCEEDYYGYYHCDHSRIILENHGGCWSSSSARRYRANTYWHLYFDPGTVAVYTAWPICGSSVRLVDTKQKIEERKREQERLAAEQAARERRDAEEQKRREAELRKQEEKRRQIEENNRRIAYYNEINSLVDKKGAAYSSTPKEMRYEFILEDETPKKNKSSKHIFVLKYDTQNGKFFMSALNGSWDELSVIFPITGLEGSTEKWKDGEVVFNPLSSKESIANEISRILTAMGNAKDTYNKSVVEKRKKKQEQQRMQSGSWSLSNLLAYPCGATHFDWKEAKKQKQNLQNLHTGLRGDKNNIIGNFSGEIIEIGDDVLLLPLYTSINFKTKGCKIAVQYKFVIKQNKKTIKNSDDAIVKDAVRFINTILKEKLNFTKIEDETYKIENLKDKIKIDNLKVILVDNGQIVIDYHIVKFLN